jgi:hypothetical protein
VKRNLFFPLSVSCNWPKCTKQTEWICNEPAVKIVLCPKHLAILMAEIKATTGRKT